MISARPCEIPMGGACVWALPGDASIAARARQLLVDALRALAFPRAEVENGRLAVSELATNVFQHARPVLYRGPLGTMVPPELWMWARSYPRRELVVTVFDACRERVPATKGADALAERGRGLGLVAEVSAGWGSHPSRSMLNNRPLPGKTVWFTLPLPDPWPGTARLAAPAHSAARLTATLARRGVQGVITTHAKGVSLVSAPCGVNVTMEPRALAYLEHDGTRVQRPLTDLYDVCEHIVRRTELLGLRLPRR
ncbi:ATP-binding protein [Thermomonospora umbrina]|uniref:Anti-sigma regulatory factor (Ser/Thr protein kinase) n=1 Tax=Thermomonospora umbrina TaxID=111806 RepID=A0A3D9SNC7_9ACTN|nr:ATP-binding protein [Thermomonospora umbrina]REE95463.1 anti-sigma regulatory factor (Ser/Thr protein kinase) [Thermomonospora umbrina]